MAYHRRYGLDVGIVRIFNSFGERMRADDGRAIPTFITQALRGEPITVHGTGEQTRSICYVADLVRGIVALLDSGEIGPVNCGTEHEMTMRELAETIVRLSGTTPLNGTSLNDGLSPTRPQAAEGMRIDPPVSVPMDANAIPAATETADPPDDPPGERLGSSGWTASRGVRQPRFSAASMTASLVPRRSHSAMKSASFGLAAARLWASGWCGDSAINEAP